MPRKRLEYDRAGPISQEALMSDEPGNSREWAIAKVVETTEEAIFIAGFLNSSDIPAEVESLHSSELPVDLGALGEVRVRVPRERLEEALAALASRDEVAPLADGGDGADPADVTDAADGPRRDTEGQ
jgi:hypothetical protein